MTTVPTSAAPAGVIHDIGYKPYTGQRYGRAQIIRALYWYSLRSAFGIGRSVRARIIPSLVCVVMMLPAAISIYKVATTGGDPVLAYDRYAYTMFLMAVVFIAVAAPEMVSRDLRHHTLPLYFSRPLRRFDYPLAKLLALATAIILLEAVPLIVMYLGVIASATSGSGIWNQTKQLAPGLLVALAYGVVLAPLTLLIASTTGRRAIATGAIAILFLAATAVSHAMEAVGTHTVFVQNGQTIDPNATPVPNGGPPGPGPGPGGPFGDGAVVKQTYDPIARQGGLVDPLRLIEGTRIWGLDATDGQIPNPQNLGVVYGLELLVLTGLTTSGLFQRYRKVGVA
ncbi:MAG TPA: ABC transporter permease [Actinocrinis sp.]|uniref:ABC transporter permease n=1 Tax=Actinocrinis sp. TaxID=1920516 RepID=UPI002DDD00E3|nr:ABC transporter permease [Actinocrinis sp.]HEV3174215.1 ABC transporter permease [Actinocrinis sp.]